MAVLRMANRGVPEDFPFLAGEVLHQLNPALDHLAWQFAFLKVARGRIAPGVGE
jgi:hypothetical protein